MRLSPFPSAARVPQIWLIYGGWKERSFLGTLLCVDHGPQLICSNARTKVPLNRPDALEWIPFDFQFDLEAHSARTSPVWSTIRRRVPDDENDSNTTALLTAIVCLKSIIPDEWWWMVPGRGFQTEPKAQSLGNALRWELATHRVCVKANSSVRN